MKFYGWSSSVLTKYQANIQQLETLQKNNEHLWMITKEKQNLPSILELQKNQVNSAKATLLLVNDTNVFQS